ncbi:protein suppressor of hairy wing-like [Bicyclus anynana]|uniref:Protein suppressor of hairy wing-like n=1 Tax=Bicyclus anynana TaxID=110368 RepID=A0A6J1NGU8_BICAN|nr:protein suppressor of hairy wing-like [Bicyclus anynana]
MDIDDYDALPDDATCSVCFAEFLDKEDLEVHIRQIHLNKATQPRFCDICTQIFPDIEEFALHIRNVHLATILCCKYCTRMYKSNTELVEHEKAHKATVLYPKISCSQCKCMFEHKNEVKDHELKEHRDSNHGIMSKEVLPILSSLLCMNAVDFLAAPFYNFPYNCRVCDITTIDINVYLQHFVDNRCRCYTCDKCCKVFTSKFNLGVHLKLLHGNAPVIDKKCPKCKLPYKGRLMLHLKTCKGMTCGLCDLTFKSVTDFTNHRIKHQSQALACEYCIYCQRQMIGSVMQKHIDRAHKNEVHLYKYHCTDCKRVFKHPKLLFAHFYSKHKDLHPYTCKICDKKFRIRKSFTLHIKLTHKSVGSVKFDSNFHVFFTDNESAKQSLSDVSQINASENNDDGVSLENDDQAHKDSVDSNQDNIIDGKNMEVCDNEVEIQSEEVDLELSNDKNDEMSTEVESPSKINDKVVEETINIEFQMENVDNDNIINKNITNNSDIDVKTDERHVKKIAVKRRRSFSKKVKDNITDNDISSDDSDIPLKVICDRRKSGRKFKRVSKGPWNPPKNKNFICKTCNKNCYTYQNYHRHIALHVKNETKVCIKCHKKFSSVNKLNKHIKNEHSSSKLTETLKKLLEKRKNTEIKQNNATPIPIETLDDQPILSTSEKFRNTIKKVAISRSDTKATIKLVDKDKISVKKYLESFTPDTNDIKITMIKSATTCDAKKIRRPFIKLTKFTPDNISNTQVKLKMPVKFADDLNEKFQVSIKLVSNYVPPSMKFINKPHFINDETFDEPEYTDTYEPEEVEEPIPEVAQEVSLVGTEESRNFVHTIDLKNLSEWHKNIKIAHPTTVAPFFKISKVFLGNDEKFTLAPEEIEPPPPPKDITLANGKKLVRANPFAHLLDTKTIDELKKTKKKKYTYYKPRLTNVAEALTKAMQKLEGGSLNKKKKKQ